jgi:predicted Zn-dependent protease
MLTASCDAPTMTLDEPAYSPTGITQFLYSWTAAHEIRIYVDRNQEPEGVDLDAAVRAGIAAWEKTGWLGEVRMRVVANFADADVIFHHSRAPRIVSSDQCEPFDFGAGGYTFFCITADSQPVRLEFGDGTPGHVKMDVAINVGALDTASFFPALVAHELGHVLDIGAHSQNPADLMNGRPRTFAPSANDASTLRYVLSRRPDVRF